VLGDSETQTSEEVKTDPLGLDKVDVGTLASDACGSEVSREVFLAESNDPMLKIKIIDIR